MGQRYDQWVATGDARQYFLGCYRLMTANMLSALDKGEFRDPEWVRKLLVRFSDYYFDALDHYENGGTPPVWQRVHERTCRQERHRIQYMLFGINAHINYDLVLTLYDQLHAEWSGLSGLERSGRLADHRTVNRIIFQSIDAVQDEIIEPGEPIMAAIDVLFGRVDEFLLSRLITHWREEVWEHAVRLLETPDAERRMALIGQLADEVDLRTERLDVRFSL